MPLHVLSQQDRFLSLEGGLPIVVINTAQEIKMGWKRKNQWPLREKSTLVFTSMEKYMSSVDMMEKIKEWQVVKPLIFLTNSGRL